MFGQKIGMQTFSYLAIFIFINVIVCINRCVALGNPLDPGALLTTLAENLGNRHT